MIFQKNIFRAAFISVFALAFNSAIAQTPAEWPTSYEIGSITPGYCVSIDITKPVVEFYKIDISTLNFATEQEAQKVFGAISNNLLSYRVDFNNQAAYLQVHTDRTQTPQDVNWWNNYIAETCKN